MIQMKLGSSVLGASVVLLTALAACGGTSDNGGKGGPDGQSADEPFFLPTGEPDNTSAPAIEVDSVGNIHAVYPAYAGGRAYYAFCAAGCTGTNDVKVVRLDTEETVANAMLALDANDRPHVVLSSFEHVYYAAPNGDPSEPASWTTSAIVDHQGDKEVTGPALAVDADGKLAFVMHTYVAYLGIGQKQPATELATCASDCLDPASWSYGTISGQIFESSQLRFDAAGSLHLATVAHVVNEGQSTVLRAAYLRCDSDCQREDTWFGTGLVNAYENDVEAVSMHPAISLALTESGAPRLAVIADVDFNRQVQYYACDEACSDTANWRAIIASDLRAIGAGLDLDLYQDKPRIAYTLDYNIGLLFCDAADCTNSEWDLAEVELSGNMDPDEIFLEENCTVGAWFLHSPSLAISKTGAPRVGYQARDISAAAGTTPTKTSTTASPVRT
jgi:hypothetical protein